MGAWPTATPPPHISQSHEPGRYFLWRRSISRSFCIIYQCCPLPTSSFWLISIGVSWVKYFSNCFIQWFSGFRRVKFNFSLRKKITTEIIMCVMLGADTLTNHLLNTVSSEVGHKPTIWHVNHADNKTTCSHSQHYDGQQFSSYVRCVRIFSSFRRCRSTSVADAGQPDLHITTIQLSLQQNAINLSFILCRTLTLAEYLAKPETQNIQLRPHLHFLIWINIWFLWAKYRNIRSIRFVWSNLS